MFDNQEWNWSRNGQSPCQEQETASAEAVVERRRTFTQGHGPQGARLEDREGAEADRRRHAPEGHRPQHLAEFVAQEGGSGQEGRSCQKGGASQESRGRQEVGARKEGRARQDKRDLRAGLRRTAS